MYACMCVCVYVCMYACNVCMSNICVMLVHHLQCKNSFSDHCWSGTFASVFLDCFIHWQYQAEWCHACWGCSLIGHMFCGIGVLEFEVGRLETNYVHRCWVS